MADPFVQDFVAEAWNHLAEFDRAFTALKQDPLQTDVIAVLFRTLHSIKGGCHVLRLHELERLVHAVESVLEKMRTGTIDVESHVLSTVQSAAEQIKEQLTSLEATGEEQPNTIGSILGQLEKISASDQMEPMVVAGTISAPTTPMDERARTHDRTIRVQVDVLDRLMNLVGELVLTRNQFLHLLRDSANSQFAAPITQLDQLTTHLQQDVMKTRLQPIGQVWSTLPRLVRDLARITGKPLELELYGAETELDRTMLEAVQEALTHLIRNAADHGIERSEERRAAGKPDIGRLKLSASAAAGQLMISLEDDGAGISRRKVLQTALRQKLISRAEVDQLSESDIVRLLFRPGFTTAEHVTTVSGRGVGLDVVRSSMERIGGAIEMVSTPGRGTKVSLKIPLTLAVMSVCVVECGEHSFALPQATVVETMQLSAAQTSPVKPGAIRVRDRVFPLIHLRAALQLAAAETPPDDQTVVVVRVADELWGLLVTTISDPHEVMIKPFSETNSRRPEYQGTTVWTNGQTLMILDVAGIAAQAGTLGLQEISHTESDPTSVPQLPVLQRIAPQLREADISVEVLPTEHKPVAKHILVIDDSLFFRQLVRNALEADGYRTTLVDSAERAMQFITEGENYDLVLCDIEMPGMNGCQFGEWFRKHPTGKETPLVAITSLDAEVHGPRIMAAGFDRLLIKFHPQQLRQTLINLLAAHDLADCERCA